MPSLAERLREVGTTGGNTEGVKISLQSHQPLKNFFQHCYVTNDFERANAHFSAIEWGGCPRTGNNYFYADAFGEPGHYVEYIFQSEHGKHV